MLVLRHARNHRSNNPLGNCVKHNQDGTVECILSAGEIDRNREWFGMEPLEFCAVSLGSLLAIHWVLKSAVAGGIRKILDEGLYLVRYGAESAAETTASTVAEAA
jgi:hypothetical protein